MFRKGILGVLAALLVMALLAGPAAWGAEQEKAVLILPESVTVQGSELLLGEIAEISGPPDLVEKLAAVSAGTAPQPGSSRNVTEGHIEVRLRHAGVDPRLVEFKGADSVRVFRVQRAPVESTVQAESGAPVYAVVVAARDIKRGEVLTLDDLQVELREIKGGWTETRSAEEFVGLRTTRTVLTGTPLTEIHVEEVPLIERGTAVTIVVQTGSVTVTAPGIARQSGMLGDVIEVENTLSRQRVSAEIIDAHTVQVQMKGADLP